MSDIDEGMMPAHVQPQRADDDSVDESVTNPQDHSPEQQYGGTDDEVAAEQAEVDDALAGISDDERADAARMARLEREGGAGAV